MAYIDPKTNADLDAFAIQPVEANMTLRARTALRAARNQFGPHNFPFVNLSAGAQTTLISEAKGIVTT